MLPVGGVDSEAVEHSTVVPGQSHWFIVIIPACFKCIFTLIVSSKNLFIFCYLLRIKF